MCVCVGGSLAERSKLALSGLSVRVFFKCWCIYKVHIQAMRKSNLQFSHGEQYIQNSVICMVNSANKELSNHIMSNQALLHVHPCY